MRSINFSSNNVLYATPASITLAQLPSLKIINCLSPKLFIGWLRVTRRP